MARRDSQTMELPGVLKRRGRPSAGKAKTAAQRMREYRQRLAQYAAGKRDFS